MSMKRNKIELNKVIFAIITAFAMMALIPIQNVFADQTNYIAFLYDQDSYDIKASVIQTNDKDNERKYVGCPTANNPYFTVNASSETPKCFSDGRFKDLEDTVYSYPKGDKRANGYDIQMANYVANELSQGINQALSVISTETDNKIRSMSDLAKKSLELVNCVGGNATTTGEFSCLGVSMRMATEADLKKHKVTIAIDGVNQGATANQYLLLKSGNREQVVRYSVPSGYSPGQYLYETNAHNEQGRSQLWLNPPEVITWSHVVHSAKMHYSYNQTVQDTSKLNVQKGWEKDVTAFFSNMVDGLTSMLGLYSIEEITLNRGVRDAYYYKGIMPYSWFKGINIIYWISQVLALFIIGFSILSTLAKRNIATFNPALRASLKDSIINYCYTAVLLLMFIPIFYILATFNAMLVETLQALVPESARLTTTMSTGVFVGIIVNCIYLFILIRINITYLIRGVTVSFLYGLAPFFISCLSFGQRGKKLFQTWMKELTSNIFLQTFNAVVMVFYLLILGVGTRGIERIILLYSFIPLNKFFKDVLMDSQSGSDAVSEHASKGMGNMLATGAAAGVAGLTALVGGNNPGAAMGGDKRAMEAQSVRNTKGENTHNNFNQKGNEKLLQEDNAQTFKNSEANPEIRPGFGGFGKSVTESGPSKADIEAYQAQRAKIGATSGRSAKQDSPFSKERLFRETLKFAGSGLVSVGALGLSMGAGAIGADSKALNAVSIIAGVNAGRFGREMTQEGNDLITQGKMQHLDPAKTFTSSYSVDDQKEDGFRLEQDENNNLFTMLDDSMINDETNEAFKARMDNLDSAEMGGELKGIYENGNVIGWQNPKFNGKFEEEDGNITLEQHTDHVHTPREFGMKAKSNAYEQEQKDLEVQAKQEQKWKDRQEREKKQQNERK